MSKNNSIIKNIETYTYPDELDGKPLEVLMIGIDASKLGTENSFEPAGFNREHITTWLKKRYYFLDGTVYAQIPRQFKHYPDIVVDKFDNDTAYATNVTYNINGIIHIYYPISDSESICLSWDTRINRWSMSSVTQPSDGTIISEKGHDIGNKVLWESI